MRAVAMDNLQPNPVNITVLTYDINEDSFRGISCRGGSIQLTGWTRTAGLVSNVAGNKFFLNGVPKANYGDFNTNNILQVNVPVWGKPEAPTPVTPAAVTASPSGSWLNGT